MANELIRGILQNSIDVDLVYHYTNMESLKNILKSESLWLSHVAALSGDKEELDFGIDYIISRISSASPNKEDKELLKRFGEGLKAGKETPICVGSFCEKRNLKSQWEKFGEVAIGFRTEDLQKICDEQDFAFGKIIYQDALRDQCIINLVQQEKEDRQVSQKWFQFLTIYIAQSAFFLSVKLIFVMSTKCGSLQTPVLF